MIVLCLCVCVCVRAVDNAASSADTDETILSNLKLSLVIGVGVSLYGSRQIAAVEVLPW